MDLYKEKEDLIKLIELFLTNQSTARQLIDFSWRVIDYFSNTSSNKLPKYESFEKEFWFAIWQIQHLCDETHIADKVTKNTLKEALSFLKKERVIPDNYIGKRP